ncbi:hypothetical protein [Treponema sp.]|uniref:hypothetical protein n=1 Tax=Treponema sp. TaxID=166 RepID=UPI0025FE82E3|nr:hypothetical protein [Treponema sp.]MCR5218438.1 hypothetical protein [Treponema sp.]
MKIDHIIIKEKSISRDNLQPVKNLHMKVNRINLMPPPAAEMDKFNCVIEVDLNIDNEEQKNVASARLSYFIFVTLDEGESYDQDSTANGIFALTNLLYWHDFNAMLKDVNLPPLPLASIQGSIKK